MAISTHPDWSGLLNPEQVDSPALLLLEERVESNLQEMIRQAGDVERLRPHIKTHKLPELVRRQVQLGIRRFKAATIAEAEMCAVNGAPDVLLAYPPVGPRARRLVELAGAFPGTAFSTVVDSPAPARELAKLAAASGRRLGVYIDIDCGQHRTGIAPGEDAMQLLRLLHGLEGIFAAGLHVYDGHIHDSDLAERTRRCDEAFAPVAAFRDRCLAEGLAIPSVVAGGTPTFPIHARRAGVELSPGTCVLWDAGYATKMPDLRYQMAAVLLARVVSKPLPDRLCLDLGHKAVASEMPQPRVLFLNLPQASIVGHNEEHMVVESPFAPEFPVGSEVYAVPWHVCPTVALHSEVVVVRGEKAVERWKVTARDRRISV